MVQLRLTKTDGTVVEKWVEKPQYGGTFVQVRSVDPTYFDESFLGNWLAPTLYLTNEDLVKGDWARGPAGTGETSWLYDRMAALHTLVGALAESWEVTDDQTIIFHIRKGVRFHDKPPVNGREMNANDVLYTWKRLWETPRSYHYITYPWSVYGESLTAPDKWTVILKSKPGKLGELFETSAGLGKIIPREVIDKYGDMNDWKNSAGTGPFMLVDYVTGSAITYKRNPNYWMKDPVHPENQLPYVDTVKDLIIADLSTRVAALRTGKIDQMMGLGWEEGQDLIRTNPELKYVRYLSGSGAALQLRNETPPFTDIRVRRALNMAIDKKTIADKYYGGNAEILYYPIAPIPDLIDMYTPFDKLSESMRELYEYHPDKAKQLLADAGYPNGFKTEIIATSGAVDILSIVKEYWAGIGVDLQILVKEYAVYTSMGFSRAYKQILYMGVTGTMPEKFIYTGAGKSYNFSLVKDPRIEDFYAKATASYFDAPKQRQVLRDAALYELEQAYFVVLPGPYIYTFWQPWVKGYQGEWTLSKKNYGYPMYLWVDQALRTSMKGRK